ncbi:hypothetical protein [Corallococcus interemptor]|uniref:hypothetical protein n=1 Tax=Corallococcus interemptor TaxID=2316720 RepID=UPI0011C4A629|nr:hypothetical protein [Corallococcus interemptor]
MPPPSAHTQREASRETGFALAAVVCAAVLAWLVGLGGLPQGALPGSRAAVPGARRDEAARTPASPKPEWDEAGLLHGSHVGAPRPASRDQVDPGGVSHRPPPTPFTPRPDTLRALLARHDARMLARVQGLRARALPYRLTPLADRPRTANCPAQGPPARG